jgi:hypothetical protein
MQVGVLGPVVVWRDGAPVDVGGERLRTLLSLLALWAGRVVGASELIDGLWGEAPPAGAANALQSLVSRLRAVLPASVAIARGAAATRWRSSPTRSTRAGSGGWWGRGGRRWPMARQGRRRRGWARRWGCGGGARWPTPGTGRRCGRRPGRWRRSGWSPPRPPAPVEDGDAVGELVGLVQVLRRQQHRGGVVDQVPHHLPEVVAAVGVEAGGGLVQEQHPGVADQAGGEVEAVAHAPGVRLHRPSRGVGELEALQQLVGAGAGGAAGQAQQAGDEVQVLATAERLVQRRVLAGDADQLPHLVRLAADVVALDGGVPGVGADQGGEDAHRGRLAGPVRAQQAEHRAQFRLEVDAGQGGRAAEALHQPLGIDRGFHGLDGRGRR